MARAISVLAQRAPAGEADVSASAGLGGEMAGLVGRAQLKSPSPFLVQTNRLHGEGR